MLSSCQAWSPHLLHAVHCSCAPCTSSRIARSVFIGQLMIKERHMELAIVHEEHKTQLQLGIIARHQSLPVAWPCFHAMLYLQGFAGGFGLAASPLQPPGLHWTTGLHSKPVWASTKAAMGLKLHQISLGSVKPGLGLVASPDPPTDVSGATDYLSCARTHCNRCQSIICILGHFVFVIGQSHAVLGHGSLS